MTSSAKDPKLNLHNSDNRELLGDHRSILGTAANLFPKLLESLVVLTRFAQIFFFVTRVLVEDVSLKGDAIIRDAQSSHSLEHGCKT